MSNSLVPFEARCVTILKGKKDNVGTNYVATIGQSLQYNTKYIDMIFFNSNGGDFRLYSSKKKSQQRPYDCI